MTLSDYKHIGTTVTVGATCFSLGVLFGNWPYDFNTLWVRGASDAVFEKSEAHYQVWANMPQFLFYVHHFIIALGLGGLFFKMYKPAESNKLFDGGSLFLYTAALVFYLVNLRKGLHSAVTGEWGEVDKRTGINILAATQTIICILLLGVLVLQTGQFYAESVDARNTIKMQQYLAAEAAKAEEVVAGVVEEEKEKEEPKVSKKGKKESRKTK